MSATPAPPAHPSQPPAQASAPRSAPSSALPSARPSSLSSAPSSAPPSSPSSAPPSSPSSAPSSPSSHASRARRLALTAVLLAGGCRLASAAPGGHLEASGPVLGDWTFAPDTCLSGQRRDFLGVSLGADAHPGVRVDVVDDPLDGLAVAVHVDGRCDDRTACPPVTLRASACTGLDGEVVRDLHRLTNNIFHVDGWLTINCGIEGGGRLEGEVSFSGCH